MVFRAVLAGCGQMAAGWIRALGESPALRGRVEVVGLVDIDVAAAGSFRDRLGLIAQIGTDLDRMLSELKPDILFDVVVPAARREVVLTGLRHGCHVLTEKPMAASLAEARELVAAARAAGRVHAVVQNRRFNPGVRRIRATIESGVLGQLTSVHADFFVGAHFGGFREVMEHVLLLDMAIHTFDAARFMAGAAPLAVYALERNPAGSWYAHDAVADAIFEFSDGIVFTYRGSWVAEGNRTSWDAAWRIVGSRGTLLWDGAERFEAGVVGEGTELLRPMRPIDVAPPADPAQTLGHASVIADFLDALESGRTPETAGEDNIRSLAMVFAAVESARTRQRVVISA